MRKTLISNIRLLLLSVLATAAMWSCQDEKPTIEIPVIPKETKHIETITPDTLTYISGDSVIIINIRTIPSDLPGRKETRIEIANAADEDYPYGCLERRCG